MRVLQVHNRYRPGWGGEETVVELEAALLRRHGHEVERVSAWTKELDGASGLRLLIAAFETVWSPRGYSKMRGAIESFSPDIIHVHNTFPLLSPSILWAADKCRVPVVYTLHNYRFTCANALLLRMNRTCEDCVGKRIPLPALRYRCLNSSFFQTAAVISMNLVHRQLGTFKNKVHAYIALSEFSRDVFRRSGIPAHMVHVKPNFTHLPDNLITPRSRRVVFAGQIVRFKGVHLLLDAWRQAAGPSDQLFIIGDGQDREELQRIHSSAANVVWLGRMQRAKVVECIVGSRFLILPSLVYENFPMSVLEAFSVGTPVIVPDHGALPAMVSHCVEGLQFSAGDLSSLAANLQTALRADENVWNRWSTNARTKYFQSYSDYSNYVQLMTIYKKAKEFCNSVGKLNRIAESQSVSAIQSKDASIN